MSGCDHAFAYAGVRFADGVRSLPGGSARRRYYAHVYFCSRCLEKRVEPVDGLERTTFDPVEFGATPDSPAVIGVPKHDRG